MAESATADSGNRYKYGSTKGQTDLDEKFSFGFSSLYFVLQRAQTEIENKKDKNQILVANENCFAILPTKQKEGVEPNSIPSLFCFRLSPNTEAHLFVFEIETHYIFQGAVEGLAAVGRELLGFGKHAVEPLGFFLPFFFRFFRFAQKGVGGGAK